MIPTAHPRDFRSRGAESRWKGLSAYGNFTVWRNNMLLQKWHSLPKFSTKNHSSPETDSEFLPSESAVSWSEAKGTAQAQISYHH